MQVGVRKKFGSSFNLRLKVQFETTCAHRPCVAKRCSARHEFGETVLPVEHKRVGWRYRKELLHELERCEGRLAVKTGAGAAAAAGPCTRWSSRVINDHGEADRLIRQHTGRAADHSPTAAPSRSPLPRERFRSMRFPNGRLCVLWCSLKSFTFTDAFQKIYKQACGRRQVRTTSNDHANIRMRPCIR